MKQWSIYPIRFLLVAMCEKPETFSPQERDAAGVVARRLLDFAKSQERRDVALIRTGIEAVCRTYESDPTASKALLAGFLTSAHLEAYGYEDMQTFAREVSRLFRIDPAFARDIYAAAFSFEETLMDQTSMGAGRILPMTSNRRQDYEHALWQFGEVFPTFLRIAPEAAVEALAHAVAGRAVEHYETRNSQPLEYEFEADGVIFHLRQDGSHVWDSSAQYRHDPHEKMLDAFDAELERIAADPQLAEI